MKCPLKTASFTDQGNFTFCSCATLIIITIACNYACTAVVVRLRLTLSVLGVLSSMTAQEAFDSIVQDLLFASDKGRIDITLQCFFDMCAMK